MTDNQPSESKLERVIRKIKRCLALSKSSNENEAATAMRQAQALMREYRLTELDVQLSDVGVVQSESARANRRPTWDRQLGAVVARAFGVRSLSLNHWCEKTKRRVERAVFVGVIPSQQIALYAYEALLTKLTLARSDYMSGVRSGRHRSPYSPETAGNHFALAWVHAVSGKLQDLVPRGEEDPSAPGGSGSHELIAAESKGTELIDQYLSSKEIGKQRRSGPLEMDMNAQVAGMLAGRSVQINHGVTAGGQDQLQLS